MMASGAVGTPANPSFSFAVYYFANHPALPKDFHVTDEVFAQFKDYLKSKKIPYTDAEIASHSEWLKNFIEGDLVTHDRGFADGLAIRAEGDPQVQKAIGYLPQAEALVQHPGPTTAASTR